MGLKHAHILFHDRSGESHDAMKLFAKLPLALFVLAFTASVAQSQPQTPAYDVPAKGGTCTTNNYIGAETIFICEHIGQVRIRQIYEKGWRVVSRIIYPTGFNIHELIIEEQRR